MFAHQRQSLLGGGNSPNFSSADALRAAGMGISLSPADVLALKTSFVDRATEPTEGSGPVPRTREGGMTILEMALCLLAIIAVVVLLLIAAILVLVLWVLQREMRENQ